MTTIVSTPELFTTAEVAYMLNRTPGAIRLLVSKGVLTPFDRVPSVHGHPTMRFDICQVVETIGDSPGIDKRPLA